MVEAMVPLGGSGPSHSHPKVGVAKLNEPVEVTVILRRKNHVGLPNTAQFINGERTANVSSRRDLAERYGASTQDAAKVEAWAKSHGLSVKGKELGKRQVELAGSVAAMSTAFGVKLSIYRNARLNIDFRCSEHDVHIPQSLDGIITGVFGLNTMPVVVRHAARIKTVGPAANPKTRWPNSFYPNEVAKLYDFPPGNGRGQRIAILEFGGGFDPAVLDLYFKREIGLTTLPIVNPISVLGAENKPDTGKYTGEVYLDIEVIGAMAPAATIDVYFAPSTDQGFLQAITKAIHNDDYAAISISWGFDEDLQGSLGNPAWPALKDHVDEAFGDAVAVGIPVFVATGDQGSGSKSGTLPNGDSCTLRAPSAHAEYPSTSPMATAVGGTLLYAEHGAITNEVVWNELGNLQTGDYFLGAATGGGVSDRYPVPSYQTKVGIAVPSANSPPFSGRCIPDVAGNAGLTTGYLVSRPPGAANPIEPMGGTSAAAPMWAALWACIRAAGQVTLPPGFFINDFIYDVGTTRAFNNIVAGQEFHFVIGTDEPIAGKIIAVGNNRTSQADGYKATVGYDVCTGWGTPNGVELLNRLKAWIAKRVAGP